MSDTKDLIGLLRHMAALKLDDKSLCAEAADELERLRAEVATRQWRPIETAPKDGTLIMLTRPKAVWVGKYIEVYGSGYVPDEKWHSHLLNHDHMSERYGKPTHWMPLPSPIDAARSAQEPAKGGEA